MVQSENNEIGCCLLLAVMIYSDTAESARCSCFAPFLFDAVTVRFIRLLSQARM